MMLENNLLTLKIFWQLYLQELSPLFQVYISRNLKQANMFIKITYKIES